MATPMLLLVYPVLPVYALQFKALEFQAVLNPSAAPCIGRSTGGWNWPNSQGSALYWELRRRQHSRAPRLLQRLRCMACRRSPGFTRPSQGHQPL